MRTVRWTSASVLPISGPAGSAEPACVLRRRPAVAQSAVAVLTVPHEGSTWPRDIGRNRGRILPCRLQHPWHSPSHEAVPRRGPGPRTDSGTGTARRTGGGGDGANRQPRRGPRATAGTARGLDRDRARPRHPGVGLRDTAARPLGSATPDQEAAVRPANAANADAGATQRCLRYARARRGAPAGGARRPDEPHAAVHPAAVGIVGVVAIPGAASTESRREARRRSGLFQGASRDMHVK